MNTLSFENKAYRSLFINFLLFSDGNERYNHELVVRAIQNLEELQYHLKSGIEKKNMETFKRVASRLHPSLRLLNNLELNEVMHKITNDFSDDLEKSDVDMFFEVSNDLLQYLRHNN